MPLYRPYPPVPRLKAALLGLLALLAAGRGIRSEPVQTKILAQSVATVALGDGPVVASLAPVGGSLGAMLDALPPGHSLYLVVRGLTAQAPPGVLYALYLDLPAGARPAQDDPHKIGIIDFYSARRPGAPNAPDAASPVNVDAARMFFSFDVTRNARNLRRHGQLAERATVTLIPEGAPDPAANAQVARLELVEQ